MTQEELHQQLRTIHEGFLFVSSTTELKTHSIHLTPIEAEHECKQSKTKFQSETELTIRPNLQLAFQTQAMLQKRVSNVSL